MLNVGVGKYEYLPENIVMMLDHESVAADLQPTRANIVSAFSMSSVPSERTNALPFVAAGSPETGKKWARWQSLRLLLYVLPSFLCILPTPCPPLCLPLLSVLPFRFPPPQIFNPAICFLLRCVLRGDLH